MERAKTGIYGLDELLQGGFPRGRTVLVSGACGTGKSIFSMQFIYRGAIEFGEPGVYVTFDEMPEKLRQDMLNFGWDVKKAEQDQLISIIDASSARAGVPSSESNAIMPDQLDFNKLMIEVLRLCKQIGAKRLVFDSIPALGFMLNNEDEIRKSILKLSYILSSSGLTTILTSEVLERPLGSTEPWKFSKFEAEEYISDGVILLKFFGSRAQNMRILYIRKMRGTNQDLQLHPFEITQRGIEVKKIEEL